MSLILDSIKCNNNAFVTYFSNKRWIDSNSVFVIMHAHT